MDQFNTKGQTALEYLLIVVVAIIVVVAVMVWMQSTTSSTTNQANQTVTGVLCGLKAQADCTGECTWDSAKNICKKA